MVSIEDNQENGLILEAEVKSLVFAKSEICKPFNFSLIVSIPLCICNKFIEMNHLYTKYK